MRLSTVRLVTAGEPAEVQPPQALPEVRLFTVQPGWKKKRSSLLLLLAVLALASSDPCAGQVNPGDHKPDQNQAEPFEDPETTQAVTAEQSTPEDGQAARLYRRPALLPFLDATQNIQVFDPATFKSTNPMLTLVLNLVEVTGMVLSAAGLLLTAMTKTRRLGFVLIATGLLLFVVIHRMLLWCFFPADVV